MSRYAINQIWFDPESENRWKITDSTEDGEWLNDGLSGAPGVQGYDTRVAK